MSGRQRRREGGEPGLAALGVIWHARLHRPIPPPHHSFHNSNYPAPFVTFLFPTAPFGLAQPFVTRILGKLAIKQMAEAETDVSPFVFAGFRYSRWPDRLTSWDNVVTGVLEGEELDDHKRTLCVLPTTPLVVTEGSYCCTAAVEVVIYNCTLPTS